MIKWIAMGITVAFAAAGFAADSGSEGVPDTDELARFLVKAKTAGYASGDESRIRKLADGSFEAGGLAEGKFSYRDRWYGEASFLGEEIVHYRGRPVWGMNFHGAVAGGAQIPAEFPKFHKSALRHLTAGRPFRGPLFYQEGELVYVNEVTGSIREFHGVERVLFRGQEIFRLVYSGGMLE